MKRIALSLVASLALVAGIGVAQTVKKAAQVAPAQVTGAWVGTWAIYQPGDEEKRKTNKIPPMRLDSNVEHKGELWQATFEGECGRPYKYTIKMEGRQIGTAVLFKGTADLGEKDGGVFDWIGKANDKEFVGFYTSEKYTGTFRLARSQP